MNNEPVAWINIEDGISNLDWDKYEFAQKHIPLYTHPVKKLTDEEIIDIWLPFATDGIKGKIAFARAILRKAQER